MVNMRFLALSAALCVSTFAVAAPAHASVFIEVEPNDTADTAQVLVHDGSITLTGFRDSSPTNGINDFFRFNATSGDNLSFRVDPFGAGDSVIRLLDGFGSTLAEDDDTGGGLASLINYNITTSGDYIAAVRGFGNSVFDYRLQVTGLTPSANAAVPEPSTWAMMLLGFGFVGGVMRRRKDATTRVRYSFT